MKQLFVLWHTYTTRSGRFEQFFLGTYASKRRVQSARRRLRQQPGFWLRPSAFEIVTAYLDHPELKQGPLTPQGGVRRRFAGIRGSG